MLARVGSFNPSGATGNQDITLPSGLPDMTALAAGTWAIIFWAGGSIAATGVWDTNGAYPMVGFVANGGGSISQYSLAAGTENAATTGLAARRMAATALTGVNGSGTTFGEASFVSFPSATTMRINWASTRSASATYHYMILTGLTGAKAINWTNSTAADAKSITGVGFSPDLVLHAGGWLGSLPVSTLDAYFSFGAMNKHGQQWFNAFQAQTPDDPTNTSRWQQTDACLGLVGASELASTQIHFQSMDADGFTVFHSASSGAAQNLISLCLDGVSSKLGAFTAPASTTGVQTVASRHTFVPRGALFSAWAGDPAGAPVANGAWGLAGTDGTNHALASIVDQDGQGTSAVRALWASNQVANLANVSSPGSSAAVAALSELAQDSFAVNWSTKDANAQEVLYCLLGDAA